MAKDRRKPLFFKVFLPGCTSEMLEVPPGFLKHIEGHPDSCTLTGPSGNTWSVELVRNQGGGLFFGDGWKQFGEDHAMEAGEFFVFVYEGGARFRVLIFDTSACEKESAFQASAGAAAEAAAAGGGGGGGGDAADANAGGLVCNKRGMKRKDQSGEEDLPAAATCMLQVEAGAAAALQGRELRAGAPKKTYSRKKRSRGLWVSQRRPVTQEEIERAHGAANAFTSDNTFQVLIMRRSSVYLGHSMALPHVFAKRYLPKGPQKITLSDCQGNSWIVTYLPLDTTYILSAGWRQFSIDNHLEQDDACVFEIIKKDEIRVHIFRVVEEVTPLIRKIIRI